MNLQCRPRATNITGNVGKIGNHETMSKGLVAHDPHAVPARPIGIDRVCMVYSNIDLVVLGLVEARLLGVLIVYIGDEPACRIADLKNF